MFRRTGCLSTKIDIETVAIFVQIGSVGKGRRPAWPACDAGTTMQPRYATSLKIDAAEGALLARTIRAGSKSFDMASLLLPERYRLPARALYAFCRSSDDAVDEAQPGTHATLSLRRRLEKIYDGRPGNALEDRAFAIVAQTCRIPADIPGALIKGFEWDEDGRRYQTIDDLLDYAARVAGTVGVMMCLIMDRRERAVLARAAELGLAMQLTNIARDVGEDAARGRIYLPLDWLAQAGVDPDEFLARPQMNRAIGGVIKRLLDTANVIYADAMRGVPGLPLACRPAIRSAAMIYRAIGGKIAANGFDSISTRARTSATHKLALIGWGTATAFAPLPVPNRPAHASVRFLVDSGSEIEPAMRGFDAAVGRCIDVLSALEARERRMTSAARSR
jgi:phytoene synthase